MKVTEQRVEKDVIVVKVDNWPFNGFGEFVMIREGLYRVVAEDKDAMEVSLVRA